MTEQQYRVIADRDKGDDPQWDDVQDYDRKTVIVSPFGTDNILVRIERPEPTTEATGEGCGYGCGDCASCRPYAYPFMSTREQIVNESFGGSKEIALGIEDGMRDLRASIHGCTPSMLALYVQKRIARSRALLNEADR